MYTHNIHLYSHSCVDRGSRHLCSVPRSVNNNKVKSIIKNIIILIFLDVPSQK